MASKSCPLEKHEQRDVVKFLRKEKIPFFAVPNSQEMSGLGRQVAARIMGVMKSLGLSPGVPDLIIFLPDKLLCIEMKRKYLGEESAVQVHWRNTINRFPYAESIVCHGGEVAIAAVVERL